jgi:inosine-uridine nucleoside N-ribohydrolase
MKKVRTPLAAFVLGLAGALVLIAGSATMINPGEPAPVEPPAAAATEPTAPVPLDDPSLELTGVTSTPTTTGAPYIAPIKAERLSKKARCGTTPERLTSSREGPVRIIFDTDFGPDVDDVGALAILHALADRGEAEILGVMVSTSGDFDAPRAVDVVNTYYGRPDIPIGLADPSALSFPSRYTVQIASSFESEEVPNPSATSLYRQLLAAQPDESVTIVSVGFKSNLDDLLLSGPDEFSPLNGADLVAEKVKLWVAMAGQFPDSYQSPWGGEYNLVQDLRASIIATALWPTPIVFSGYEVGAAIKTGGVLQGAVPEDNPVREAYRLFTGGDDRESWDLTAVWYAVRGSSGFFDTCYGRIEVNTDGSNGWNPNASGHAYLKMKVEAELVAEALDELLVTPPASLNH